MVYTTGNTLLLYNRIRKLLYGKDKKMKEQNHPNVIKIRNAHVHNLKHINADIPLNKIVGIRSTFGTGSELWDTPCLNYETLFGLPCGL